MNPMNKLPESPKKIVAGLKLKRRNPRIAPVRATVSKATRDEWLRTATTKTTRVENSADPAASPSSPSIRLNALVIPNTQRIVSANPTNQGNWRAPKRTGRSRMRKPPNHNIVAAMACTVNFTYGPTERTSSYSPRIKIMQPGTSIVVRMCRDEPKRRSGRRDAVVNAAAKLRTNAPKMATPPRRGNGAACRWRSEIGAATQPWDMARLRIYRVRTNDRARESPKIPR